MFVLDVDEHDDPLSGRLLIKFICCCCLGDWVGWEYSAEEPLLEISPELIRFSLFRYWIDADDFSLGLGWMKSY